MKYGIPKNTMSALIKNKEKTLESIKTQGNKSERRRLKHGTFTNLDDLIFKWLLTVRSRNLVVSASNLKTKAKELAEKINIKALDGWLDRWKNRYNDSFKTVSGEDNSCTAEMTTPWKETTLPMILSKYKLDEIYNADEFGLFFRMHLISHLIFDLRLAEGENTVKFVLLESRQQMQRGIKYRGKEKKKVALLIDNCPAHPTIDNLKFMELIFLPPNITSKLQLMDQGVIPSLKAYYKALPLQRLVMAIDKGKDLLVFSILDAMKMLDLAWQKVETSFIVNCFAKAGISKDQQKSAKSDDDDPLEILKIRSKNLVNFTLQVQQLKMSFLQTKTWCVQYLY